MRLSPSVQELTYNGRFLGLHLEADFCAEHEHGIKDIRRHFSPKDSEKIGLEKRKLNNFDEKCWLINDSHIYFGANRAYQSKELENPSGKYKGAWDEHSFGVWFSDSRKKYLNLLAKAAQNLDLAVWIGGTSNFLANCGLNIVIASTIPYHMRKELEDSDRNLLALNLEAQLIEEKFKFIERLQEKGFEYFALSPSWSQSTSTKFKIKYWLNPYRYKNLRQEDMRFGWITVEEIEKFLANDDSVILKG